MRFIATVGIVAFAMMFEPPKLYAAASLGVEVSPVHEVYHLGEPIELQLSIRNTGDEDVDIHLLYPTWMGVGLTCEDADAVRPPLGWVIGSVITLPRRLAPGEEYSRRIALARSLRLRAAKTYTVDFVAVIAGFRTTGRFVIAVEPGPVDPERVRQYVENLESDDDETAEEAAELLRWTDDPVVIEPLVRAAQRVPNFVSDIGRTLAGFEDDRARSAILDIARGNVRALSAALREYAVQQRAIPMEFYASALQTPRAESVTLAHLLEHGGAEHISLVEPFADHENPRVREQALEFLEKMRQ